MNSELRDCYLRGFRDGLSTYGRNPRGITKSAGLKNWLFGPPPPPYVPVSIPIRAGGSNTVARLPEAFYKAKPDEVTVMKPENWIRTAPPIRATPENWGWDNLDVNDRPAVVDIAAKPLNFNDLMGLAEMGTSPTNTMARSHMVSQYPTESPAFINAQMDAYHSGATNALAMAKSRKSAGKKMTDDDWFKAMGQGYHSKWNEMTNIPPYTVTGTVANK